MRSSDDEIIGAGGSILKFIHEKKTIIKVIFSRGQLSHPHLKESVITRIRKRETEEINKRIGIKKTVYFNLTDGSVKEEISSTENEVIQLIKKYKPKKVFTLNHNDPHHDHRAVSDFIHSLLKKVKYKNELYEFEVWNIKEENQPCIYIDITPYFKQKIELMKLFKSQWISIYSQLIPVYFKARRYGRKIGCKFAERFWKIR